MSPTSFIVALAVVTATLSLPPVEGYYYYYYYYSQPNQCQSNYIPTGYKTCPISSCHCSTTYNNCCLRYFTYGNVLYKQCICGTGVTCAPTNDALDNPPPQTTQSTTTTTTTTTTPTTTPTTTSSTTTPTTTTTTPTTTTTTPTTTTTSTTTTTTPTTTSTTTTPTTTTTTPTTTTTKPTTTTTTARTTTTKPTTATSTTTRTTTTRPTTTTTPTTTSTSTTTTPTTTSTTTASSTTPAFRSLCDSGFRLLNGDAVSNCDFNGVANITQLDGELQSCNAVFVYATVNGVLKPTFMTASSCTSLIQALAEQNAMISEIQIGRQRYPITTPLFNMVQGPNGAAFLDMNERYANLLGDLGCQKPACAYNRATMEGKVDMNDCKMVSWGVSDAESLMSTGLHEVKIALKPTGCSGTGDTQGADSTLCFTTASGKNLNCAQDGGAPIYCKAPSNGEDILMGVSMNQVDCDSTPDVKVIPYPG